MSTRPLGVRCRRTCGSLRRQLVGLLIASLVGSAAAAPLVIEESARIALPDQTYVLQESAAIWGDYVLLVGRKYDAPSNAFTSAAFMFQRQANGEWRYVTTLDSHTTTPAEGVEQIAVAMNDGVAATVRPIVKVFELGPSGWSSVPADGLADASDAELDAGTLVASEGSCGWDAQALRKNAAGAWVVVADVVGRFRGSCDDEFVGGDVDVHANHFIVANQGGIDDRNAPSTTVNNEARIYTRVGDTWTLDAVLTRPSGAPEPFGAPVSIDSYGAYVGANEIAGVHGYTRAGAGVWDHSITLQAPDSFMIGRPAALEANGLVFAAQPRDPQRSGSVNVFRPSESEEPVAKLLLGHFDDVIGRNVEVHGSRALVIGNSAAYLFELPADFAQPERIHDDFNDGDDGGWTPSGAASFTVANTGSTLLYRQSNFAGDALALRDDSTDWRNQAIEADVTPTAFNGPDRWVGLVVRRTDAANYYYATLRSSNSVQLKRMHNGVFITLDSAAIAVSLNRTYRLRLEAIGSVLRVYVDGVLANEVIDTALTHGQAGLLMSKARADYDNVIVSPGPLTEMFADDFSTDALFKWTPGPGAWGRLVGANGSAVYRQTDAAGDARTITGAVTTDQVVETRAKAVSFAAGGQRWFGVMTRYTAPGNYYYVTIRNHNEISLRRVSDGRVTVLDSAPMSVAIGVWRTIRFEAIGAALRVFVDGRLILEANDAVHTRGRYGLVTFGAKAHYDYVRALQP